ncbi:MAG: hypothetical protein QNK37_03310 [Acidobacteriota bacterium]|nr:hypothetical protein [Acidobacteriota bacterium]
MKKKLTLKEIKVKSFKTAEKVAGGMTVGCVPTLPHRICVSFADHTVCHKCLTWQIDCEDPTTDC